MDEFVAARSVGEVEPSGAQEVFSEGRNSDFDKTHVPVRLLYNCGGF